MRFSVLLFFVACSVMMATGRPQFEWARNARDFAVGAYRGTKDMHRAYSDMKDANWKNSDKYFHARGNQDAASRGSGGKWAAKVISNARELTDRIRGGTAAQSAADQAANKHGRNGGNLNTYRPSGLPKEY